MIMSLSDGCSGISTKYSQNVEARTDERNAPPGPEPVAARDLVEDRSVDRMADGVGVEVVAVERDVVGREHLAPPVCHCIARPQRSSLPLRRYQTVPAPSTSAISSAVYRYGCATTGWSARCRAARPAAHRDRHRGRARGTVAGPEDGDECERGQQHGSSAPPLAPPQVRRSASAASGAAHAAAAAAARGRRPEIEGLGRRDRSRSSESATR